MLHKRNLNRGKWDQVYNYLTVCLILLGVLVRTVQYLSNRSLWGDEVDLALNIIERSYRELAQVLDHNQAAPLGFLWLEKLITQIWGISEYALRFVPLIAGILSLGIFYQLVRRYCSALAVPIAIALFACGKYTLYFTTELKPYSSDLAIAIILFWLLVKAQHKIFNLREMIGYGCLGSLAIWFSYPTIFMLGGLEGWNLLTANRRSYGQIIINRLGIYLAWLASFGLFYWLTIANTLTNEDLNSSWASRYPDSVLDILWLFDALGRFFYHPLGFRGITDGIGIFAFIVGCIVWYRSRRTIFLALISPFVVTIIAAYLHKYPFRDRLILFLAPWGIMIIAEGIACLLTQLSKINVSNSAKFAWLFSLLGMICLSGLTLNSVYRASNLLINPEKKQEVRPVLEYVAERSKLGEKVYVYEPGNRAFAYYLKLKGYSNLDYTYGTINFAHKKKTRSDKLQQLTADLKPLRAYPVWFILRADDSETSEILEYLDQVGQRQDDFRQVGASAYLYNLNNFN